MKTLIHMNMDNRSLFICLCLVFYSAVLVFSSEPYCSSKHPTVMEIYRDICSSDKEWRADIVNCSLSGERQRFLAPWMECGPQFTTTNLSLKTEYNCEQLENGNKDYVEPFAQCMNDCLSEDAKHTIYYYLQSCQKTVEQVKKTESVKWIYDDFCDFKCSARVDVLKCLYKDDTQHLLDPWMECGLEFPTECVIAKAEYGCLQLKRNNIEYLTSYSSCVASKFPKDKVKTLTDKFKECKQKEAESRNNLKSEVLYHCGLSDTCSSESYSPVSDSLEIGLAFAVKDTNRKYNYDRIFYDSY